LARPIGRLAGDQTYLCGLGAPDTAPTTDPLDLVALDIERHVAGGGWDQAVRLFALVPTTVLTRDAPELVGTARPQDAAPGALSAVEQEDFRVPADLESALAALAWPEVVTGAAIAVERIVVPPAAEQDLPIDPEAALSALAAHPDRRDVRLVVAVTRDGRSSCLLRQRDHDRDDRVAKGRDIAPGLVAGLLATFVE
jgi:hypothetical protein